MKSHDFDVFYAAASPEISENTVAIGEALRTLPAAQRRAVVLFHLCGLSIDEVARETGTNVNTTKTRLARGRAALAVQLGDVNAAIEPVLEARCD